jgi:hypothetical protein
MSECDSTASSATGKPAKPNKPYPDFSSHRSLAWRRIHPATRSLLAAQRRMS